ncbi:ABC transporter permease [Catenuloplanes japonicus]|uniref:ABC transporter permease n=1 Tax=Catenuloplanes japonicus TaxID=33876 RepID=UPI000524BEB4|nr:ABC transporter permease subunit [Catenuloplanes japonicus]
MRTDDRQRLSLPHLVSSEWLKLRSLRSFWLGAAGVVVLTAAGALLPAIFLTADNPPSAQEAPQVVFQFGSMGGQIALLVIAVLAMTSEYSRGAIRLTFAAAPARLRVIAAKAVVVTAVSASLAVLSLPVAYVVCVPALRALGLHPAARDVLGGFAAHVGYLILVALFAFAVGLAVRSTAAGVGLGLGVVFVLPSVLGLLGDGLRRPIEELGFTHAAHGLFTGPLLADALTVAVWLAVPFVLGGLALVRQDA